jgi:hypothetical protein
MIREERSVLVMLGQIIISSESSTKFHGPVFLFPGLDHSRNPTKFGYCWLVGRSSKVRLRADYITSTNDPVLRMYITTKDLPASRPL